MGAVEAKCGECELPPVVPAGLAWRWGRDSRRELAGILVAETKAALIMSRTRTPLCSIDAELCPDNKQDWGSTAHYQCATSHKKKGHRAGQMTRRWLSMTLLNIKQQRRVKKDTEIRLYWQERRKGMHQRVAAERAGIG